MSDGLLAIYLNDHLSGATGGLELFRRAAATQRDSPAGPALQHLAEEVAQDRASLEALMALLGVTRRSYKVWGGWALEKVARVKPNGHLLTRSPLSDLVELEGLVLGVQGKAAGFRALRAAALPELDDAELDRLISRAERQGEVLEELRLAAAARALQPA